MRQRLLAVLLAFAVVAVAGFAVPLLLATAANRTQQFVLSRTADAARFAALAQENRTHLVTEVRAHTTLYGDDVVVVDARRRVVVEAGMRAADPDVAAAIDAALRNQPRQAPGELRPWSGGTVLFTQAVGTGTNVSGAVVLRSSVTPAVTDIRFRWAVVLLAALVAAVACVLLVLRIARWLLRPVAQLADGVHAVAAGRERTHVDVGTGPPELRGLAEQFNQMSDALAESAGRQRQLVADASHQLRNPLAALRLRIDTLASTDPAYDPVVSELDRLEALLDGMLTLASADSMATDLAASAAHASCDAATVLADRIEAWGQAAHTAGVRLDGEIPAALPVHCAEPELAQVLDVVLDNAIKYAGAGATIRWTCHATPANTTLTVDDDGPGVPEEHLERLTERFWRATTATPGSGLGLAIAERLTTAHGGRFTVTRSDRGGLAVTVTLRTAP